MIKAKSNPTESNYKILYETWIKVKHNNSEDIKWKYEVEWSKANPRKASIQASNLI